MKQTDTIFAPASAQGHVGITVMRISGPDAGRACELCTPKEKPKPRTAVLRKIHNPANGELIDRALLLWFPGPHSFNGEDIVELHIHGGRAVLKAVIQCLQELHFRLAEPGEFTRRAFEHGKLDLTEAEALADLVHAETEAQRRQAMRQLEGALGKLYEDWCVRLTKVLAYMEAAIDFADEDLPNDMENRQRADIRALIDELTAHLNDKRRGERLREGFEIAILGPPNAGKSSLLNALAQREAAIVSSLAGTTRDVIEVHLDLGGYPVTVADTAGLRESKDAIESEGVKRALARAEKADLKLLMFDGALWPALDQTTLKLRDENAIMVINKADLIARYTPECEHIPVSAKTGAGVAELLGKIVAAIDARFTVTDAPPLTRERHRAALEDCKNHLERALTVRAAELCAEEVRLAVRALGRIMGRVDVEDLLDVIFRDFCIGK